jgi:hypothetical protein
MIYQTGEVPERPNGAVSKTVVGLAPTVGSNPTLSADKRYEGVPALSAERITFRASSPAATLGERMSKC